MAIGGGRAAAMAIVNMAFNSHGSCWPSTNSHDHPNYVLCLPLSLPMRKFDEPSFAVLSSGRARVNRHPPVHQCGWMVHWWVVPFSSLPVPGLTQVVNSSWPFLFPFLSSGWFPFGTFFFLSPHARPGLTYLPMHPGLLPPPLTHLPTHLPTYSSIWLHTHQPTYLCTYALNLHQGNDDTSLWGYCNILDRLLCCPSYLPPY
jgi:hypothetical protein